MLKQNNWFKNAIKIAFAVGDDANKQVLAEICGTPEAVISIYDPEKIRSYIKFVTAAISKTGTTSQASLNETPQERVIKQIQDVDDDQPFVVDIPDIEDDQW